MESKAVGERWGVRGVYHLPAMASLKRVHRHGMPSGPSSSQIREAIRFDLRFASSQDVSPSPVQCLKRYFRTYGVM